MIDGPKVAWRPQPGPQTALLTCPVQEVFYGGARGGGKTDGLIGDFVSHAGKYEDKARGILFRRTYPEFSEILNRSREILHPLGWTYYKQDRKWIAPNGATLILRYLYDVGDAETYQGHNYCVALGTLIVMADGTQKPIEQVQVGELVQTLEGPCRVKGSVKPYLTECVETEVFDGMGVRVGMQVHPETHPILTTAGVTCEHKRYSPHSVPQWCPGKHDPRRFYAGFLPGTDSGIQPWFSWSEGVRSDCTELSDSPLKKQRRHPLSVPVVLHEPTLRSVRKYFGEYPSRAIQSRSPHRFSEPLWDSTPWTPSGDSDPQPHGGRAQSTLPNGILLSPNETSCVHDDWRRDPDSLGGYPSEPDSYDELVPSSLGIDPGRPPSPDGVGGPSQHLCLGDSGTIPTHTRPSSRKWVHPYTGEERYLREDYEEGQAVLRPCGPRWVTDLCVEGANHYITSSGLVNKNTWMGVDEAGNYPDSAPIDKMRGTLRSAHGVPTFLRLTGNPGGVGHLWLQERYVLRAPPFQPFHYTPLEDRPDLKFECVFIPATLDDNLILQQNDPTYEAQLAAAGGPDLFKAWRHGDWNAMVGTAFPEWRTSIHTKPFPCPPDHYLFLVGMDWGYTSPGAAYVLAVGPGGRTLVVMEHYFNSGTQKQTASHVGNTLGRRLLNARDVGQIPKLPEFVSLDADCWAVGSQGQEEKFTSIAQLIQEGLKEGMGEEVIPVLRSPKGKGSRIAGKQVVHEMLAYEEDREGNLTVPPLLVIHPRNTHLIRTLPALPKDPKDPQDVDTDAEDHPYDALRYGLAVRTPEVYRTLETAPGSDIHPGIEKRHKRKSWEPNQSEPGAPRWSRNNQGEEPDEMAFR